MKIEPMEQPKKGGKVAIGAALMIAMQRHLWLAGKVKATTLTKDIVGVTTVCFGETRNIQNRRY